MVPGGGRKIAGSAFKAYGRVRKIFGRGIVVSERGCEKRGGAGWFGNWGDGTDGGVLWYGNGGVKLWKVHLRYAEGCVKYSGEEL